MPTHILQSPNFPNAYPNNAHDCYVFTPSADFSRVTFLHFDTQPVRDHLTVSDFSFFFFTKVGVIIRDEEPNMNIMIDERLKIIL